jgi:transposase
MLNPYFRRSRMDPNEFLRLVHHFCGNKTATEVAHILGRQRKTVNTIFNKIRARMAEVVERESPFTYVDDAGRRRGRYKGVEFIRGAKEVGALNQMIIGVFEPPFFDPSHGGNWLMPVFTEVLPDRKPYTIGPLGAGNYRLSHVFTYDELLGIFDDEPKVKIDLRTDTFYPFFGRRMNSFYGIPPQTRYLHMKENEWRFNNRMVFGWQAQLFRLLRDNPL